MDKKLEAGAKVRVVCAVRGYSSFEKSPFTKITGAVQTGLKNVSGQLFKQQKNLKPVAVAKLKANQFYRFDCSSLPIFFFY
jgi:hypothetical protein